MDYTVHGVTESDTTERLSLSLHGSLEELGFGAKRIHIVL